MVAPGSMSLSDWDSNFVSEVGSDSLDQVTINTYIILFGLTLVLFDLILYVHSTIFQLYGTVLPGFNQY